MSFFSPDALNGTDRSYVIAEVGHNHRGRIEDAVSLLQAAKAAGANAVKLQKRDNRALYTTAMFNEVYSSANSYGPTYGTHREALEFGREEYMTLRDQARELDIDFFSTAFDFNSVDFLVDLDLPLMKFASADITNTPLLRYAAETRIPMIMSTGGADIDDVRRAVDCVGEVHSDFALLQCTAIYPTPADKVNLRVIEAFRREFPGVTIGLSGHDDEPQSCAMAYALGARVFEKHFTLDRTQQGSDHHFSLEPTSLAELVSDLETARLLLGSSHKSALPEERSAVRKMGKSLVLARGLRAGHVLAREDIAIKSPGGLGLPPYELESLLGRQLRVDQPAEAPLSWDSVTEPAYA